MIEPPNALDASDRAITPRLKRAVLAAAVIPLAVLIALFFADVPLGQPDFLVYRYSPIAILRLERCLSALLIGACGLFALRWGFGKEGRARYLAGGMAWIAFAAIVVWSFLAPPHYVEQHSFNMLSPSHDGAFVLEGREVASVREYMSTGFFERLRLDPEDMRGRRVLSNPPGVTVASVLVHRFVDGTPAARSWLVDAFGLAELDDDEQRTEFAAALLLAVMFTVAWGVGMYVAYRLCRLWMAVPAASAVAFACVFNPATLEFTPGKDPAQLLTVLLIAYSFLLGYKSGRRLPAAISGGVLAAATMIGLIHLWVFAIVVGATGWHALRHGRGLRFWALRGVLPAALGAAVIAVLALIVFDWNIVLTTFRVAVRYQQIQLPIITEPFYWMLVGFPVFLLFVGPLFWVEVVATRRDTADSTSALGFCLLVATIAVMAYTYFFANNSEVARLWIPFVPLLLVGMALRRSAFRADTPTNRRLAVLLIALQMTVTLAHWSVMDVRESECRLYATGRMWD